MDEKKWLLQDFQRSDSLTGKRGEHETFLAHIAAAAVAVSLNPNALLVFSGGRTSRHDRTEAEGYAEIFSHLKWPGPNLKDRICQEQFSTDSYQNLLFSIIRFRSATGRYPEQVTVITHAFKERRFLDLHAPAIRWPISRIRVQGINPPFTADELSKTAMNEHKKAYELFALDPYGGGCALASKRRARNWLSNPFDIPGSIDRQEQDKIYRLLKWNGGATGQEIFPDPLPWSVTTSDPSC